MTGRLNYPYVQAHAANYAPGRQGYRPVWFVLHATATAYADNYPANLGRYWGTNPVQVSVHFCCSDTMTYQYVDCDDTAYQCRNPGNLRGIGVELVGQASWTRNEWLAHKRMLRRAAQLCAQISLRYGFKTTPDTLTPDALRARQSGLTCHRDLTATFAGTHTDPGPDFPWDYLASELRVALAPVAAQQQILSAQKAQPAPTPAEEDIMAAITEDRFADLEARVARLGAQSDRTDDIIGGHGVAYPQSNLAAQLGYLAKRLGELDAKLETLTALLGKSAAATGPSTSPPG